MTSKFRTIDLLPLVNSNVDMEFWDADDFHLVIAKLNSINGDLYESSVFDEFKYCRIRKNHWHPWMGGKCPLPEGLEVKILLRNGDTCEPFTYRTYDFEYTGMKDFNVIAFMITDVKMGWSYG